MHGKKVFCWFRLLLWPFTSSCLWMLIGVLFCSAFFVPAAAFLQWIGFKLGISQVLWVRVFSLSSPSWILVISLVFGLFFFRLSKWLMAVWKRETCQIKDFLGSRQP